MFNKKDLVAACLYSALIIIGIGAIAGFYKKNMNVLSILEHPHPVLRQVAEPVVLIDDTVISLAEDIITTLRYQTLVDFFLDRSVPRGLAAPQVGSMKRLVVCGIGGRIKVMVNPEILERKGTYLDRDGCLSVREEAEPLIKRSAYVKVKYKTLDNLEKILVVRNDDAALVEHEIDHLNGVLNIDYIMD